MNAVLTVEFIQDALDSAIARRDPGEVKRLSIELAQAQDALQVERQAERLANERTAAVNMQQSLTRREQAQQRALAATRRAIEAEAPECTFTFGRLRVVVTFKTADAGLVLAAGEAIKQAALLMQRAWNDRLQAIRHTAATETALLEPDAETAAMAFKAALHYAIQRDLVRVTVKKR